MNPPRTVQEYIESIECFDGILGFTYEDECSLAPRLETADVVDLELRYSRDIDDRYLEWLLLFPECQPLWAVDVRETSITDSGLRVLPQFPQLEYLKIADTNVTDAGMEHVGRCANLISLTADRLPLTEKGVEKLTTLKHLEHIIIEGLTDAGIRRLAEIPSLKSVGVQETSMSDEGLMSLAVLPELKTVYAYDTQITPEGSTAFRERRPDVELVCPF